VQGLLASHVAPSAAEVAQGVGEVARQHLAQPGPQGLRALAPEGGEVLVRLQQRLLHDVRWVEFGLQARVEPGPRQQAKGIAEALEVVTVGRGAHAGRLLLKAPSRREWCAPAQTFSTGGKGRDHWLLLLAEIARPARGARRRQSPVHWPSD